MVYCSQLFELTAKTGQTIRRTSALCLTRRDRRDAWFILTCTLIQTVWIDCTRLWSSGKHDRDKASSCQIVGPRQSAAHQSSERCTRVLSQVRQMGVYRSKNFSPEKRFQSLLSMCAQPLAWCNKIRRGYGLWMMFLAGSNWTGRLDHTSGGDQPATPY